MAVQASVHLDPKDMARVKRYLTRLSPEQNRNLWKNGLSRMAILTQKEAQQQIAQGRGKKAPPLPNRLTGRTNALLRSIEPDLSEIPRLSSVGTVLIYGGVHENSKRSYLEPGLNSAQKRFGDIMVSVLGDELRKADREGLFR